MRRPALRAVCHCRSFTITATRSAEVRLATRYSAPSAPAESRVSVQIQRPQEPQLASRHTRAERKLHVAWGDHTPRALLRIHCDVDRVEALARAADPVVRMVEGPAQVSLLRPADEASCSSRQASAAPARRAPCCWGPWALRRRRQGGRHPRLRSHEASARQGLRHCRGAFLPTQLIAVSREKGEGPAERALRL